MEFVYLEWKGLTKLRIQFPTHFSRPTISFATIIQWSLSTWNGRVFTDDNGRRGEDDGPRPEDNGRRPLSRIISRVLVGIGYLIQGQGPSLLHC